MLALARLGLGLPGNCLSLLPSLPSLFLSFHFISMPNNRPIARTRMKGRLLPNLEVHRSLQAPSRGCSRNPETEQAAGGCYCRGPRCSATGMLKQPLALPRHHGQANIPRHQNIKATRSVLAAKPPQTCCTNLPGNPWDLPGESQQNPVPSQLHQLHGSESALSARSVFNDAILGST